MSRPTIIINDLDAERIDILLEQPAYAGLPIADALNAELDRAQMCSPEEMPHDVVTMNSRVKFRNLSDGEVRVRTLVYPAKMTDSNTQLSVMAPVGAALLGLRVGDSIHWELPGGVATHLEVLELEYQPEAASNRNWLFICGTSYERSSRYHCILYIHSSNYCCCSAIP